jgi:hypothetical protein
LVKTVTDGSGYRLAARAALSGFRNPAVRARALSLRIEDPAYRVFIDTLSYLKPDE